MIRQKSEQTIRLPALFRILWLLHSICIKSMFFFFMSKVFFHLKGTVLFRLNSGMLSFQRKCHGARPFKFVWSHIFDFKSKYKWVIYFILFFFFSLPSWIVQTKSTLIMYSFRFVLLWLLDSRFESPTFLISICFVGRIF